MKDPINGWYTRGWRRSTDPDSGRVRMVYEGEYYTLDPGCPMPRVKRGTAAACALYTVVYLLSAVFVSEGAMWRWVGLFQILTLVPLIYFILGTVRLCLSGERMTFRDYHAGPLRLRKAAGWCTIFGLCTLGAELVYILLLAGAIGRELLYVLEILVYTAVPAGVRHYFRRVPCRIEGGE